MVVVFFQLNSLDLVFKFGTKVRCGYICFHSGMLWFGFVFLTLTGVLKEHVTQKFNVKACLCEQVLFVCFYNNPAPLNRSMQFHYCTLVTREPEQTTLLF